MRSPRNPVRFKVFGRETHRPVENWLEYARDNYMGVASDGKLGWITRYYDPIVNHKATGGPGAGVGVAFLLLPQSRELATFLYESAANALGWNNPRVEIRGSSTGLIMARALGDHTAVARLRAAAERDYDPRFFGDHNQKFGWWFGLNEAYPRGQRSASMMVAEVGTGDAWYRAFEAPHMDKFEAPTVEGIDFPSLGIYQAWNDTDSGTLYVGTYAAAPDRRGLETSWRVTNLPNTEDVFILCDGEPFTRFAVDGPSAIRIDGTVDLRRYQIFTGYRRPNAQRDAARRRQRNGRVAAGLPASQPAIDDRSRGAREASSNSFSPGDGPTCPCCLAYSREAEDLTLARVVERPLRPAVRDLALVGARVRCLLTGKASSRLVDLDLTSGEETRATVLKSDPDWSRLPADTRLAIRKLLRRCLDTAVWRATRPASPALSHVIRTTITPSVTAPLTISGMGLGGRDVAIAPDGLRLVYVGANSTQLPARGEPRAVRAPPDATQGAAAKSPHEARTFLTSHADPVTRREIK